MNAIGTRLFLRKTCTEVSSECGPSFRIVMRKIIIGIFCRRPVRNDSVSQGTPRRAEGEPESDSLRSSVDSAGTIRTCDARGHFRPAWDPFARRRTRSDFGPAAGREHNYYWGTRKSRIAYTHVLRPRSCPDRGAASVRRRRCRSDRVRWIAPPPQKKVSIYS